jgi:hypothetical protein
MTRVGSQRHCQKKLTVITLSLITNLTMETNTVDETLLQENKLQTTLLYC